MFKLFVILSMFMTIQGQLPGGFTNRPDLVKADATRTMVRLAVTDLKEKQNLLVSPVNVVNVATQVVNGINYRIVFTARSPSSSGFLTCTTKIYQQFSGLQSVSSVICS
ncbi:hypothetical protein I4U23_002825 [Adineta vaga]|nr:hypothetical protein I4U23_002825 [Adineta vaga]